MQSASHLPKNSSHHPTASSLVVGSSPFITSSLSCFYCYGSLWQLRPYPRLVLQGWSMASNSDAFGCTCIHQCLIAHISHTCAATGNYARRPCQARSSRFPAAAYIQQPYTRQQTHSISPGTSPSHSPSLIVPPAKSARPPPTSQMGQPTTGSTQDWAAFSAWHGLDLNSDSLEDSPGAPLGTPLPLIGLLVPRTACILL